MVKRKRKIIGSLPNLLKEKNEVMIMVITTIKEIDKMIHIEEVIGTQ